MNDDKWTRIKNSKIKRIEECLSKIRESILRLDGKVILNKDFNGCDSELTELLDECKLSGIDVSDYEIDYQTIMGIVEIRSKDIIEERKPEKQPRRKLMPRSEYEKAGYSEGVRYIPSMHGR